MRHLPIAAVALTLVASLAQAVPVDSRNFVEAVAGNYTILKAGGEKPKEINSSAEVEADSAEAVFVMPFCLPDGLCDPGYLFFEYGDATVDEVTFPDGVRYDIVVNQGGKKLRYSWEESNGEIRFTNYQYTLGNIGILTHILEEKDEEAY